MMTVRSARRSYLLAIAALNLFILLGVVGVMERFASRLRCMTVGGNKTPPVIAREGGRSSVAVSNLTGAKRIAPTCTGQNSPANAIG
jgi:hypothetical protein